MKNYKVKAIMKFTDKEEDIKRIVDDEFFCTKERYEFLKSNGAVTLVEIVEEPKKEIKEDTKVVCNDEEVEKLFEEPKPKKKKSSKK